MITRGTSLGGRLPFGGGSVSPRGESPIRAALRALDLIERQTPAGAPAEPGISPLGEIIAMQHRRDQRRQDWADAVPEPTGRAEIWQQDYSTARFEVATFLGPHALVRSKHGGAWRWRIRAGLTRIPSSTRHRNRSRPSPWPKPRRNPPSKPQPPSPLQKLPRRSAPRRSRPASRR